MRRRINGSLVKRLREEAGLSQAQLAERVGAGSQQVIHRLETKGGWPKFAADLPDVLGASLDELTQAEPVNQRLGLSSEHDAAQPSREAKRKTMPMHMIEGALSRLIDRVDTMFRMVDRDQGRIEDLERRLRDLETPEKAANPHPARKRS